MAARYWAQRGSLKKPIIVKARLAARTGAASFAANVLHEGRNAARRKKLGRLGIPGALLMRKSYVNTPNCAAKTSSQIGLFAVRPALSRNSLLDLTSLFPPCLPPSARTSPAGYNPLCPYYAQRTSFAGSVGYALASREPATPLASPIPASIRVTSTQTRARSMKPGSVPPIQWATLPKSNRLLFLIST